MEGATFPEPIPLHALNPFCPKEYQSKAFTKKSLGAQAAIGRRIKFPKNTSNCKSNTPVKKDLMRDYTEYMTKEYLEATESFWKRFYKENGK